MPKERRSYWQMKRDQGGPKELRVYELRYSGDGDTTSEFYATKTQAIEMARKGRHGPELFAHTFEPTIKGVVELLNHVAR